MHNTINYEQLHFLLAFFIAGIIIGIFFDIFRIIRKSFNISDFHTYLEDIIFGIVLGTFLIYMFYIYNFGSVRLYMIFSMIIGLIGYVITISKYFIKANVMIINFIKNIICKILNIIFIPLKYFFKLIKKWLNKPFTIFIINVNKLRNFFHNEKNKKKLHKRKDFI